LYDLNILLKIEKTVKAGQHIQAGVWGAASPMAVRWKSRRFPYIKNTGSNYLRILEVMN
jgi:hypothetical protein